MPLFLVHSDTYLKLKNYIDINNLGLEIRETVYFVVLKSKRTGIEVNVSLDGIKHEDITSVYNLLHEFEECPEYYQSFFEGNNL